jgi:death-on-curing protein
MIEYLTLDELLEIHFHMIDKFGGLRGVRDKTLLQSAVDLPKSTMFGEDLYPTIYDKAAAYLFCIIKNHPFNDANKRTGCTVTYLFLQANNIPIRFSDEDYEDLAVGIASGQISKEIATWFLEHGNFNR